MVQCKNCKNNKCDKTPHGTYVHYCGAGMWDRTDEEQDWLHDDEDFEEYLNKDQFCSDYIDL